LESVVTALTSRFLLFSEGCLLELEVDVDGIAVGVAEG
jgi:hypothetical protein